MFGVSEYIQLQTVYEMASHRKIYIEYQMNTGAA